MARILVLGLLTAVAAALHTHALDAGYWIDEGISVGISSHHLVAIPGVLRQDGSPPLYYLLLHGWMALFGSSPVATHALSAAFAIAAVPAAYWAIAPLSAGGGLVAAAIIALDPFVGLYADETRMYSLVLLLSVVVCGCFLRALVLGRAQAAAPLAIALALLLYTHAWGAFLAASAGAAWLGLVALGPHRRELLRTGAIAFGGALALFAPWVPTLLYQARHTAAPWSHRPVLPSLGTAMTRMGSGQRADLVLSALLVVGGVFALVRGGPGMRSGVLALLVLAAATLLGAWAYSRYGSPAWALRYLVVVLGPLALVIGLCAGRIPMVGPVAVVAVLAVGLLVWGGRPTDRTLDDKSDVASAAVRMDPLLPRGTVVFSTQPEQVPNLDHYLPAGMRFVTPLGAVPDAGVFDWRDALARLRAARYAHVLGPAVRALRRGERLLLVQPRFSRPDSPWTVGIRSIARRWGRSLRHAGGLRRIAVVRPRHGSSRSTVVEILLERT
ncbi:MAG: glycosyltransferase family 39 protein [Solirubrobacteraceae bacterium]